MCHLCVFSIVKVHNGFDAVALKSESKICTQIKNVVSLQT